MASCVEIEEQIIVEPTPGKEVKFAANLTPEVETRTLYGDESATGIVVNWVEGDLVTVYGTGCSVAQADYSVELVKDESGNPIPDNYAKDLVKTGTAGIQWGTSDKADFYAVYPATKSGFSYTNNSATVTTSIATTQYNQFMKTNGVWKGVSYDTKNQQLGMRDAIMYACLPQVSNGSTVDLTFTPFATVLKFHIDEWTGKDINGNDFTPDSADKVLINSIKLTAPNEIAGEFDLNVSYSKDPSTENYEVSASASTDGNQSKIITIAPTTQLEWSYGEELEFSVFTIPTTDVELTGEWTVTLDTSDGFKTFALSPKAGQSLPLSAGKINKLNVKGFPVTTIWHYEPETWIKDVPRNVYLSELSLPGTWYSAHDSYQNHTSMGDQYQAGIRAFNLDCRITYLSEANANSGQKLVVAGTDGVGTAGANYDSGDSVLGYLETIAALIPDNEYVVVVLTIAEKPMTRKPLLGATKVSGTVDPKIVVPEITNMLNANAEKLKLYTDKITSQTTVNDVLGHMIVKINTNNSDITTQIEGKYTYTYPQSSLVSFASMAMEGYMTNATTLASDYYTKMNTSSMYWGNEQTDLTYYYCQAQRTTEDNTNVSGVPTIQQRKKAIDDIIQQSSTIYKKNLHNGWFQLGIGGYIKNNDYASADQSAISDALNEYVSTKIQTKMEVDPSPVGIVLMNHATTTDSNEKVVGIQLVNDIIKMNGLYYLNRDLTKDPWPTDGGGTGEGGLGE